MHRRGSEAQAGSLRRRHRRRAGRRVFFKAIGRALGAILSPILSIFSPPKIKGADAAPPAAPTITPPTVATPEVAEADLDTRRRARLAQGRTSTFLTAQDAGLPSVAVRTLLGG